MKALRFSTVMTVILLTSTGCLTKRTVTQGGRTVSQKYVIKRPIKDVIENSR